MGPNIEDPGTYELAKELSELIGEAVTAAATRALEERFLRLRRVREESHHAKIDEVMAIVKDFGGVIHFPIYVQLPLTVLWLVGGLSPNLGQLGSAGAPIFVILGIH